MFIINDRRDHFIMEFRESYAGETPLVMDLFTNLKVPETMTTEHQQLGKRVLDLSQEALLKIRRDAMEHGLPDPTLPQTVLGKPSPVATDADKLSNMLNSVSLSDDGVNGSIDDATVIKAADAHGQDHEQQ